MITGSDDPFNLSRFTSSQDGVYDNVLAELRSGQKRTHWMRYIFPQIEGLGRSATAKYYAIRSLEEAGQYLKHPILGSRLLECTGAVLAIKGRSISEIFCYPDDLKFKSSMTLFSCVAGPGSAFDRALEKYFQGELDFRTMQILAF